MAYFNKAYKLLKEWENKKTENGIIIYSNLKADKGGETIFGIARNYHKDFNGWKIVDKAKEELNQENKMNALNISKLLIDNEELNSQVKDFYFNNFWKPLKCEKIKNQAFAENLFLLSVNAGIKKAVTVGQVSCNIEQDGIYGNKTENAFINAGSDEVKKFTETEIEFYKSIVKKDKTQKIFLEGWIDRANAV